MIDGTHKKLVGLTTVIGSEGARIIIQNLDVPRNGPLFRVNFSIKYQTTVLRDFGRWKAEKLVTDRENYRSDNFAALGEWVV